MTRRQGKGLKSEDEALWDQVRRTVRPLNKQPRKSAKYPVSRQDAAHPEPAGQQANPAFRPEPFRIGQSAGTTATAVMSDVQSSPIDRKVARRMKRGKLLPEARIDLHGMTQDRAHRELNAFILGAAHSGLRLVLVITGKGRTRKDEGPIPETPGILRRNVPIWLHGAALSPYVLDVVESHRSHGGAGAYYVYLRRRR